MKLKIFNSFINKWGFELVRVPGRKGRFLKDVFNTGRTGKRVLISYITDSFINGIKLTHSIFKECYTAATVFHELGYTVDVANYFDATLDIDYSLYEVVYGQGYPLEKSFYAPNREKIKKISYGTGTSLLYFFKESGKCVDEFYRKNNLLVPESARMDFNFWPMQFVCADAVVVLGNKFCEQTYLLQNPGLQTHTINAFYFDTYDIDLSKKNFAAAKKHFLWFGSSGLLYKGLGKVLDVFKNRKDLVLHICGANYGEQRFWQYYRPIVEGATNIINHGFIDIQSAAFKTIMDTCAFVIFPSVSEGGSPATLNAMANGGLIPIISRATSLDVEEYGYIFDEITEENINDCINNALTLTDVELHNKATLAKAIVRSDYTYEAYQKNMYRILSSILQ